MCKDDLRERLLSAESKSPEFEERYRKEMKAMLEQKLRPHQRWAWAASCILSLSLALTFGATAVKSLRHGGTGLEAVLPIWFGVGSLFALVWAVFAGIILKRGRLHLSNDSRAATGFVWFVVVLVLIASLLIGSQMSDTAKGNQMILSALAFFTMFGVVGMLQHNIKQAELRTREHLLRLELQLKKLSAEKSDGHV